MEVFMNKRKLYILTAAIILLFCNSCVGSFEDPSKDAIHNGGAGGGGGSSGDGTPVAETGSIRITNNSSYDINSGGYVYQNNKVVKNITSISRGGNTTVTGVPVGSRAVRAPRAGTVGLLWWERTVTVTKNGTASVIVNNSGWRDTL
jgi:hypothetical protein